MEASKFITVVIWATIVLIAYEVYKSLTGSTSTSTLAQQLGVSSSIPASTAIPLLSTATNQLAQAIGYGEAINSGTGYSAAQQAAASGILGSSPAFDGSSAAASASLGDF